MVWKRKAEVMVVGAGPVGLYTALRLAEAGIGVKVVDEQFQTAGQSYALALHPSSLSQLDDIGLADELIENGHRVERLGFYDGTEKRETVDFSKIGADFPFVLVLPQSSLESALERRLSKAGVKVQWNHQLANLEVQGAKVVGNVNRLEKLSTGYAVATTEWVVQKTIPVEADVVVGADGHRSAVRRAAGIDFEKVGPSELFAVFEFFAAGEPSNEATLVFDETGKSVLWPLPDGRWRWSFQIPDGDEGVRRKSRLSVQIGRGAFPHVAEEDLATLVADRAPWFGESVTGIRWSMVIRFEKRLAACFGRDRIWLAGDSAHLAGPVGIHSMNIGLREARDLAGAIERSLRGDPGSTSALGAYGHRCLESWRALLGLDVPHTPSSDAPDWIRPHAAELVSCLPVSGPDLERLAGELGISMGGGKRPAETGS